MKTQDPESQHTIARAAGLMSIATLISRILGYVKDMILARFFGATGTSDVFFVAFRIPNLLRELLAEGAMSSAFIPTLTDCQVKDGERESKRLVRSVFVVLLTILTVLCILGVYLAPQIVPLIAPGFVNDPQKLELTVMLTRIMFPFLLFVSLSSLVMGVLNTRGIFFIPALAPALLNVTTIVSVVFFAGSFAHPVTAVAVGVVAGGAVQFLFQLPSFYKQGYSLILPLEDFKLFHSRLKTIGLRLLPATFAMAVSQINIFVSTVFASFLKEGSITALYYSMRLIQFPIGVFGVAMGMAALPALSRHASEDRLDKIANDFGFALRLLFFIAIPSMVGLICLREPIVNLLFQRGAFDYNATLDTATALMYYSFGIWAIVGVRLCTTAFYALDNTVTPVKTSVVGIATNILLCYLLIQPMGHNGIALANSLSATVNFGIIYFLLKRRLGLLSNRAIVKSIAKTLTASVVMGLLALVITDDSLWKTTGQDLLKTFYLGGTILLCLFLYGLMSYALKSEELNFLMNRISSRLKPTVNKNQ